MILYLAMYDSDDDYLKQAPNLLHHKLRFEAASGMPCLIRRYTEVTPAAVARYPFRALVISGFATGFDQLDRPGLLGICDLLHSTSLPVLGLCGGHQLIAVAFNNDFPQIEPLEDAPMRQLRPGEPDFSPDYHPGWYTETGMQSVRLLEPADPLFAGLPETLMVLESHYCEVKRLPPGFQLLATNDNCQVQAMRHAERPIYGTQFHPEAYTEHYSDGRRLLENFFAMANAESAGGVL
jgi:GMP synthase-like glutamine amidotransferase